MPILPDGAVILARAEEGGARVELPFVEDGVDGDGEEGGEGFDQGVVGLRGRL